MIALCLGTTSKHPRTKRAAQHVLSREREHELARQWRLHLDPAARDLLVRSQLHNVVAIARKYRRSGRASLEELIAEGNYGLVRALDKFDPERGTRLVTYAVYWIRAYISRYLVRARSVVNAGLHATAVAKVRRKRDEILSAQGDVPTLNEQVASELALSAARLDSMLERVDARDQSWDATAEEPLSSVSATSDAHCPNPEETILQAETQSRVSASLWQLVAALDDRERYIVERRTMAHREEQLTLADIGCHFGVSRERARQLEARALSKIRTGLARAQTGHDWLFDHDAA
jgi:RNA polymerase sigma-32 factor